MKAVYAYLFWYKRIADVVLPVNKLILLNHLFCDASLCGKLEGIPCRHIWKLLESQAVSQQWMWLQFLWSWIYLTHRVES